MPNIPDIKPEIDINDNQAVDLLLESIAFEELGLAHTINAEAEKVQFVLGTLDGKKTEKAPTIDELLQINESVDFILKDVIKEEMLLEFKLEDIIKLTETTSSITTSTSSSTTTSTNTTTSSSSTSTSTSTHTTTSTQSTTTTTTKNDKDIEGLSVSYSSPTYTGNGSNRVGSTTVTLAFTLSNGSTMTETEIFDDIKVTTSKDFNYAIGSYDVAVNVTVTTEGMNNNMNITGATAEITSKVVIY